MRKSALWTSILLHLTPLLLVLLVRVAVRSSPIAPTVIHLNQPRLHAPRLRPDPGGGGGQTVLPARKGHAPVPVLHKVFVPPMIPQVDRPQLPLIQAMLETPSFNIEASEVGDPLGRSRIGAGGQNGLVGIGRRPGKGIGGEDGTGLGDPETKQTIKLTRNPEAIYKPEPDYSEEARKARFQGVVLLGVEIGTDGRAHNIRVLKGPGMGLNEKAIEAVTLWRFRPALSGNQPVAVPATVEVAFHLL